jgi:hypothetical protein
MTKAAGSVFRKARTDCCAHNFLRHARTRNEQNQTHNRPLVHDATVRCHRAIQNVADEQFGNFAQIQRGHIPRPVYVRAVESAGKGFDHMPLTV